MLARIALLFRMRLKIVVSQLLLRQDQLLLLSATHGVLLLVHRAEDAALAGAKMDGVAAVPRWPILTA
jgi:hypothetical protein